MTVLAYEHHTNVTNIHQMLNRFGTFAAAQGWTIEYNLTNVGTWNTGTGTFGAGLQTFLMISQTGAGNGNHAAQNNCYQLFTNPIATGGVSGDQGSMKMQIRINSNIRVIGDASCRATHPVDQFPQLTDTQYYRRFNCKGTTPPNVWFFGNARFLAVHYDNDGISNSSFHLGTWNMFDKSASLTDTSLNYLFNFHVDNATHEWDATIAAYAGHAYYTLPRIYIGSQQMVLGNIGVANTTIREDHDIVPASAIDFFAISPGAAIGNGRSYLLNDDVSYMASGSGYKMSYGTHRILVKPISFWKDVPGGNVWRPLGECDHYYCDVQGLATGATITNGSKQFLVFPGFYRKKRGMAYRIV